MRAPLAPNSTGSLARRFLAVSTLALLACAGSGCSLVPSAHLEAEIRNPFPQLHSVAVLPFANLSSDPTVNQLDVAEAYQIELQSIPGFEVMPVGVAVRRLEALGSRDYNEAEDFQQLARELGVDAVVVGAVTDFNEYYPPRMGIATNWYAANPSFHPIPPGYGLPWGTADEEFIPERVAWEAEFALAREQLRTQTPAMPTEDGPAEEIAGDETAEGEAADEAALAALGRQPGLPPDWPDPTGFIPPGPQTAPPDPRPQDRPIIEHVRQYDAADRWFTQALAERQVGREDLRNDDWTATLHRKQEFIRFCCRLHLSETLSLRGGAQEPKTTLLWESE